MTPSEKMTSADSPGPSSRSTWSAPTALPQSMAFDDSPFSSPSGSDSLRNGPMNRSRTVS